MKNPEIEYIKKNKTSFEKKVEKFRLKLSPFLFVVMSIWYAIDSFKYNKSEIVEGSYATYLLSALAVSILIDIVIAWWMQARENELAKEYRSALENDFKNSTAFNQDVEAWSLK